MNVAWDSLLANLMINELGISLMSLSLLNVVRQPDFTFGTCLPGARFLFCWRQPPSPSSSLPHLPRRGSYGVLVLLCNVLHMAAGRGAKLPELNGVFVQHHHPRREKEVHNGCLKRGCQDVGGGPAPAHPSRQLLPARRPSTNNLLWEEVSAYSVRADSVYSILSEKLQNYFTKDLWC